MGIKHFYQTFKRVFSKSIINILHPIKNYDMLIIEINGLFYNAINNLEKQKEKITHIKIFEHTCNELVEIVHKYERYLKSNSSILIVMDGVAPLMKMRTQRARRLKNVIKRSSVDTFDINSLSVGTSFLNFMSKYIDWFLRKWIHSNHQTNLKIKNFSFYFNNEKNKGEGEIKSIRFIKKYAIKHQTNILLHSMDADWIIASLLLSDYNITIHRQQDYISNQLFIHEILKLYSFNNSNMSLKDFFLMFLFLGNDYVDSIDNLDVDTLVKVVFTEYKKLRCHLFVPDTNNISISNFKKLTLMIHIRLFGSPLQLNLQQKTNETNLTNQQQDYGRTIDYIFNLQNIVDMHESDDFEWGFYYTHKTIPSFLSFQSIDDSIQINRFNRIHDEIDVNIYYRLLLILPKSSKKLLPNCLATKIDDTLYEDKILYDIKSNQVYLWDTNKLQHFQERCKDIFKENKHQLSQDEKKRSLGGKVFLYKYDPNIQKTIRSYYGDLYNNKVRLIHL
jgi:5'-3' exonuclease